MAFSNTVTAATSNNDRVLLRPPLDTWESLSMRKSDNNESAPLSRTFSLSNLASTTVEEWADSFVKLLSESSSASRPTSRRGSLSLRRRSSFSAVDAQLAHVQRQQRQIETLSASSSRWIQVLWAAHFAPELERKKKQENKNEAKSEDDTTGGRGERSAAAQLLDSAAAAAREIDAGVSVFAQRHPVIFEEGNRYARDVLRMASWMQSEDTVRRQKEQEDDEDGEVSEGGGGRERDDDRNDELRPPSPPTGSARSSSSRSSGSHRPSRPRVVGFQHEEDGPADEEAEDATNEEELGEKECSTDDNKKGDQIEEVSFVDHAAAAAAAAAESSVPTEAATSSTSPAPPESIIATSASASSITATAETIDPDSHTAAVAYIQQSLALFLVAIYSQQRLFDIPLVEMWSRTTLQRLAEVAELEVAAILPRAFLRSHVAAEFLRASPSKQFDACARVLSFRLGPWLGSVLGPLLLSKSNQMVNSLLPLQQQQQQQQKDDQQQQQQPCWIDPLDIQKILSECRFAAEITVGLAPCPLQPLRSMMFDRASKMKSVASLSAAITRRARHVGFSATSTNTMSRERSFRSRPRSPPPEEAAVEATAAAFAAAHHSGETNQLEEKQLTTGEAAAVSAATAESKEKRVPHLFADIPMMDDDDNDDGDSVGEEGNGAAEKSSGGGTGTQHPVEEQQQTKKNFEEKDADGAPEDEAQREEEDLRRTLQQQLSGEGVVSAAALSVPARGLPMVQKMKDLLLQSAIGDVAALSSLSLSNNNNKGADVNKESAAASAAAAADALTLKHLLPVQAYNIVTWAVRRGVNLGSVAQVRSVGPKLLRESGVLVSPATHRRFVEAMQRLDKSEKAKNSSGSSRSGGGGGGGGPSSKRSAPTSLSLVDVLSALDVQIGRGILEAEKALELQIQENSSGSGSNENGRDSKPVFTITSSHDIPALVAAAAQVAFETPSFTGLEAQVAQLHLLADFRRQKQQQRLDTGCQLTPAAVVVALQDAAVKAQTAYVQHQQQQRMQKREEEEAKKREAASGSAADSPSATGGSMSAARRRLLDATAGNSSSSNSSQPRLRSALPHYVTSSSAPGLGGVCASSRCMNRPVSAASPVATEQQQEQQRRLSPRFGGRGSPPASAASVSPSLPSVEDAPQFASIPVQFGRFPLPGQFMAESEQRRREQREAERHVQLHSSSQRQQQPPMCAYEEIAPGLDMVTSERRTTALRRGSETAAAASGGTGGNCGVEQLAMRRQLRAAMDTVLMSDAVPAEVQGSEARSAAQALQAGAATVTGVRALRALKDSDISLRLAAPTGVRGELRSTTDIEAPDLSEPARRMFRMASSVLDERHRKLRRQLKKIRRDGEFYG